jgi:hypothetical protein
MVAWRCHAWLIAVRGMSRRVVLAVAWLAAGLAVRVGWATCCWHLITSGGVLAGVPGLARGAACLSVFDNHSGTY